MNKISFMNIHLSFAGMLYKLSVTAKLGCVILSLFYMLGFLFNPLKPLGLTPGYIIPPNFWIWTVVTHLFIETNIFLLLLSFVFLVIAGSILEPIWGTVKLVTFYLIVGLSSGFACGCFFLFVYMCNFNTYYLFDVHIYGAGAIIGGILVGLKQKKGDTMLIGSVGFYMKDLPFIFVTITAILGLTRVIRATYFPHSVIGTLIAWIYLRFYESTSRGRGDPSEQFAFKFFFPKFAQGVIGKISDIIYKFLLKIKVCRKRKYRYDVGAPGNINLTLSGVKSLDAERRRNRAIKALDEHLKKSVEVSDAGWPSLEDDEEANVEIKHYTTSPQELQSSAASSGEGSTSPDIVTIEKEVQSGNVSSS